MACPTPLEGVPPIYFCQNNRKECSLDYLDGFGHFLFGFGAATETSSKWRQHLVKKGLKRLCFCPKAKILYISDNTLRETDK